MYEKESWRAYTANNDGLRVPEMDGVVPSGWVVDGKYIGEYELFIKPKIPILSMRPHTRVARTQLSRLQQSVGDNLAELVMIPNLDEKTPGWIVGLLRIHEDFLRSPGLLFSMIDTAHALGYEAIAHSMRIAYMVRTGVPIMRFTVHFQNLMHEQYMGDFVDADIEENSDGSPLLGE